MDKIGKFKGYATVGWVGAYEPWNERDAVTEFNCDYFLDFGDEYEHPENFYVECELYGDRPIINTDFYKTSAFERVYELKKMPTDEYASIEENIMMDALKYVSKHKAYDWDELFEMSTKEYFDEFFPEIKESVENALKKEMTVMLEDISASE